VIVTGATVRKAAESTLKAYLPGALILLAAQEGIELPEPRSWKRLADYTDLAEHLDPAVVVTAPGVPEVVRMGSGSDQATWLVRTYAVAGGQDFEQTSDRVATMIAAIRATYSSKPSLGGLASSATWLGEKYDELAREDTRTIGAASVDFHFVIQSDRLLPPINPVAVATVDIDLDRHS
jgi:hypothetical protein